jgi:hypothetical protein
MIMLFITYFTQFGSCYLDKIDYKNINFELIPLLEEVKEFLPVAMILKVVEQYTDNYREMEIELESCFLNLTNKTHFVDELEFDIQQRKCLSDFFNFFSLFQILRNIMFQFFGENCPKEFIETCKDFLMRFEKISSRVEKQDAKFANFFVKSDHHYKRLEENFALLKPESIQRVVMNSILIINKENFYQQVTDVLNITEENVILDEAGEEPADHIKEVEKTVGNIESFFEDLPGIREDPLQHPEKYLLKFSDLQPIEDMKVLFRNEDNTSSVTAKS